MAELLELWQLVAADLKTSYESNSDTNPFTDTLLTKLTNVEDNATIDLTGAEIKSLLFVLGDTNNLTTDLLNKLNAIEDNATIDLTGSEIKTLLFNVADTNNFSNNAETKLAGISENANNYSHPNHTGDVTSTGDGATVIVADSVTLDKMADMATASLLGRDTAATGTVEVLSKATAKTLLAIVLADIGDAGSIASKDFSKQTQTVYDGLGSYDADTLYFNTA